MNTSTMNLTMEVAFCEGSTPRVVKNSKLVVAKWHRGVQLQLKHHKVIRQKWVDIVEKSCGISVRVEAVSSTTGNSSASNQLNITVNAAITHSVPTPNQPNREDQILSSEELSSSAVNPASTSQFGRKESYQANEKLHTMQQPYDGEECVVKVRDVFKELILDWAKSIILLLLIDDLIIENIQKENPPKKDILIIVVLLVSVLQGTHHLKGSMQATTQKKVLLLLIGLMSINGTSAGDLKGNTAHNAQSCSAMDENAWERGDYLKVSAFTLVALMGSTAVWWMWNRRAAPEFEVDRVLRWSPIPRRSNPMYEIHAKLPLEFNP